MASKERGVNLDKSQESDRINGRRGADRGCQEQGLDGV